MDEDILSTDPMDYIVSKLDHWPKLTQYAMKLLACPAAIVLSERAFNFVVKR